jgi:23S rRNA (cytidine1920-2'-O)/16S rRNA (cytidine1409-2'-O)-methyltransferase
VLAVDTGWGQIAQTLRSDPRVALLERTNARKLAPDELQNGFPERTFTFLAMDVSFISATLVLPAVLRAAPTIAEAVVLVKPQFEAGREWVGKGGIVRDPEAHLLAQERVAACARENGAQDLELIDSPITGAEGNREFLLHARWERS